MAEPVEAIQWEPCSEPVPERYQCRKMVTQDHSGIPFLTTVYPQFYRARHGKGVLQFGRVRNDPDLRYRLVAELDGPVRVAFLQATKRNSVCELLDTSLTDSHYVFYVTEMKLHPSGIISGRIGAKHPDSRFVRTGMDASEYIWWATPHWLVTIGRDVTAESWDGLTRLRISDLPGSTRQVYGAPSGLLAEHGDHGGIAVWTTSLGAAPFLPRSSDPPQSRVGNFVTDGTEMAWLSRVQGPDGEDDLSTMELWTAPFTTDPKELESTARRVVAFPYGIDVFPLALGCGYVAGVNHNHAQPVGPNVVVVRLRDGAEFAIGGKSIAADGWEINRTLGINCSSEGRDPEVIVTLAVQGAIARFPIAPLETSPDGGR